VLGKALASHGRIVVTGGNTDRDLATSILAAAPNAIDATGRLPLLASAELIGRAALLVTNDSLPQHLASAMGTRTVAIFGPTIPGFGFGPLAPGSVAVGHESMPCRPCHPHGPEQCPLGHHLCMRDLGVPAVLARALTAIAA
jgi:heptosyltransferase-2